MAKKNKQADNHGMVYSTNPNYQYQYDEPQEQETLAPAKQKLRVQIDRKKRKGKEVVLVSGFVGSEEDLKALGKLLKAKCGVGGSVKDGEIIIQGNMKEKVAELLLKEGYKPKVI